MPLGKDSITKRVAKPAEKTAEKPAPKKAPAKKPPVKTAVVTNIAPETVEKVTGAKACEIKKTALGEDMPYYLL